MNERQKVFVNLAITCGYRPEVAEEIYSFYKEKIENPELTGYPLLSGYIVLIRTLANGHHHNWSKDFFND
jgi:hypothetical protein